jgi:hypothetical protein
MLVSMEYLRPDISEATSATAPTTTLHELRIRVRAIAHPLSWARALKSTDPIRSRSEPRRQMHQDIPELHLLCSSQLSQRQLWSMAVMVKEVKGKDKSE